MSKIKLGSTVRDIVSEFEGIAISRHSYLNGCDRISVQPVIDKEGKLPNTQTFDEPQLSTVKKKIIKRDPKKPRGGPERYMPSLKPEGNR